MPRMLHKFWRDERGATAVEYGLICALVFTAFAATMPFVAQEVVSLFEYIEAAWASAIQ